MKYKIELVILPTDRSVIATIKGYKDSKVYLRYKPVYIETNTWQPLHLYATVSQDVEPIKEGDWFINTKNDYIGIGVCQLITNKHNYSCIINTPKMKGHYVATSIDYLQEKEGFIKIIATTDPKLTQIPLKHLGVSWRDVPLPQLQQSFIEEYCNRSGKGEWEIEYEEYSIKAFAGGEGFRLKINQDNTVNITSVEEKMYSGEEVYNLFEKFHNEKGMVLGFASTPIQDWLKENLK